MTQLIDPSDPRNFTVSSDGLYDRHHYKIIDTFGKSVVVESWEEVQQLWWNTKNFLSHIEILDKTPKNKGFA